MRFGSEPFCSVAAVRKESRFAFEETMRVPNFVRKLLLSITLGGHSLFGVGMSREKIEELLHAMHQARVEVTIEGDEEEHEGENSVYKRF